MGKVIHSLQGQFAVFHEREAPRHSENPRQAEGIGAFLATHSELIAAVEGDRDLRCSLMYLEEDIEDQFDIERALIADIVDDARHKISKGHLHVHEVGGSLEDHEIVSYRGREVVRQARGNVPQSVQL